MMQVIEIDLLDSEFIVLKDIYDNIYDNDRILISFRRLEYKHVDNDVIIPIRNDVVETLQKIEKILSRSNFTISLEESPTKILKHYEIEKQLFFEFSKLAKDIRNDKFDSNPELVTKFELFQESLSHLLIRRLYPLQLLSSFHLAFSQNSCNFSVPGAGKTSVVYGAFAYLNSLPQQDPRHVDKILVIGPLSSFAPWEIEYEECFGKEVRSFRMSGGDSVQRDMKIEHLYSPAPPLLTLIFHGAVETYQKGIVNFLQRNKTMLIVDEAHRIKNPEGVWGKSAVEISKYATARVVLTGTPLPNGYEDIFNLIRFIYPNKYKDILQFSYGTLQDLTKNSIFNTERIKTLKENLSPYFIRIKKDDLHLPPVEEKNIFIPMSDIQSEIYDFIEARFVKEINQGQAYSIKEIFNRAKLIRLRQAATNPTLLLKPISEAFDEDDPEFSLIENLKDDIIDYELLEKIKLFSQSHFPSKFEYIFSHLTALFQDSTEKLIIWTIFIQNAYQLQKYLFEKNLKSSLLIGAIGQGERETIIHSFNDPLNLETRIVIANPFSVAESISLHKGCHNAIYLERDYNCSNFIQSKDRIHRVGLPDGQLTSYTYLISKNSVDEVISEKLDLKVSRMEKIIGDDIPLFAHMDDNSYDDIIKEIIRRYDTKFTKL